MKITDVQQLRDLFEAQGKRRWELAQSSASRRIQRLKRLRVALLARQDELYAAMAQDFQKPGFEAWLTEVFPTIEELDTAVKNLRKWMRDKPVAGVFFLPGSRSLLRHEAKGRVLILSPWNYPAQLLLGPLVSAIAAGNTVIAKPSNKTPATASFLASLLEDVFPSDEVAVVEGPGAILGDQLLELPFDHVFFTGSPSVGAKVGQAAQKIHAGLTLELGGKSPAIVLADANLEDAAAKLLWGKTLNAGQTCIAPDYLFCPTGQVEALTQALVIRAKKVFGDTASERKLNPDFPRIVDVAACGKHQVLVEDAVSKGAVSVLEGEFDVAARYAPVTILKGVTPAMTIMDEEIFGPLIPIIAYDSLDEVLTFVQGRPKPLALYIFGRRQEQIRRVVAQTTAGSTCINNVIVQIENLNVPFGGIGMSGTGNYHGHFGFRTFSHERNIMRSGPVNLVSIFYPPYDKPSRKWGRRFLQP